MVKQDTEPVCAPLFRSGCSSADVTTHMIGQGAVTNFSCAHVLDPLKIPDHRLLLVNSGTVFNAVRDGEKRPSAAFAPGEVCFIPGNIDLKAFASRPIDAEGVQLPDSMLREKVLGDIDHNRIDFRLGKLPPGPTGNLVHTIASLVETPDFHWPGLLDSLYASLAASVVVSLSNGEHKILKARNGLSRERKQRVLAFIEEHYTRQITLADLAAVAALSVFHFGRSFRATMGVSPVRYVAERRVKQAKHLMRTTNEPLSLISYECGFASQSHFTTAFRATTGVSPGAWRISER